MTDELVHLEIERSVAKITLDSPANRNALSAQLIGELAHHLRQVTDDPSVRVIHLTATGTVFCSGADLKEGGRAATEALPGVLAAIMTSFKPVVAELNGAVRAGGIGVVAACDIVVAPTRSTFAFSEVRVGVIPAIVSVPLSRRVMPRAAARWFLTGSTFGADEAAAAGLISLAVPDDQLRAVTDGIVDAILLGAPGAVAGIKPLLAGVDLRSIDEGLAWTARLSAERFESEEAVEGIAAFIERRPPRWAAPA